MNYCVLFVLFVAHLSLFTANATNPENSSLGSFNIQCDFEYYRYGVSGSVYECEVENTLNILSADVRTINSVNGSHIRLKTNMDVHGFVANRKNIHYFPKGLESLFENIKLVHMKHNNLVEIHQSDLKPLKNLTELNLSDNDLKVIEADVFAFNIKLVYIQLSRNKITQVDPDAVENLFGLRHLYINDINCIDERYNRDYYNKNIEKGYIKGNCLGTLNETKSLEELDVQPETSTNSETTSQNIRCDFDFYQYDVAGSIYQCTVMDDLNIKSPEAARVESLKGYHTLAKKDSEGDGFVANNKNAYYFPRGIEKFLPRVRLIEMKGSNLMELHQTDLKPFPHLVELNLDDNKVKVLEKELFDFNTKIRSISFARNKIMEVHPEVFDKLPRLEFLHLIENKCIDEDARGSFYNVNRAVGLMKKQCIGTDNNDPETSVTTNDHHIHCDFGFIRYEAAGLVYWCKVESNLNIKSKETARIDSVIGRHGSNKTNKNVDAFVTYKNNVRYFPKGLKKLFGKFKLIQIMHSNLIEVHQSDLKPFPKLLEIDLSQNEIEVIESGLFDFNTKLKFISFSGNRIVDINPQVFSGLNNLNILELEENICVNKNSKPIFFELYELIELIQNHCAA